ncbi:putative amidohydrolase [Saccharomonospora amisosensis]|uniref:Putative amidohydrolase n=1 Tax=Saccharomonospora amisosensis TaxID=1128677 RepID=A0A7X5UQP9_9PSEU|nr:carbon-nitrogen hydrolase family protein [Saccharomonospora amisosensis]NIJ12468.1 putative amidohydrolase [Saccharomonospora amisosensis]
MRQPLPLAAAQPWCVGLDVAANARAHARAVRAARARVVVFPELSLTGYELRAPAVGTGDPRLAPLEAACAESGSVALAGAPVAGERGRSHIAMLAVDGIRTRVVYRKMWLGSAECARFSPGEEPGLLEVDGWRLGLAICKDTGVAEHAAGTVALGIDAYVAGTVKAAHEAALQSHRADRVAIEHGVWVAVASFAGPTGGGFEHTAGGSSIRTPAGEVVAEAGTEPGEIVRALLG